MPSMSPAPEQPKVEKVETTAATPPESPTSDVPEVAGTPVAATSVPQVKLRPKGDVNYPLTLTVVGSDPIVFASESDVKTVDATVGEQVTYLPNVEVIA